MNITILYEYKENLDKFEEAFLATIIIMYIVSIPISNI